MTNIKFYGGVGEIGGNKIQVEGRESSFFFDFGLAFKRANDFLAEFLQPRKSNGILDFVTLGLLPCIKGIYREDYLKHSGLSYESEPAVDGVLISHSHVDHVAYIHHLREDIPIYLSNQSFLILKALEDTGVTSFSEYTCLKKSFHLVPKKRGDGHTRSKDKVDRDIRILKPYDEYYIGEFKVKSVPVDHSLPGASAYIVDNDDDTIVYSGDLRFHGRHPELTNKFTEIACKSQPTIMLSEGTRINRTNNITEADIERKAVEEVSKSQGLVLVNYPLRDLDRLITFYNVAQKTDRKLVVSLKQAYILNLFQGQEYPDIDDVIIYKPRRGWGLIDDKSYACVEDEWLCTSDIDPLQIHRDYKKWERDFLDADNIINYRDLQEEPGEYLFRCDFFELKELIDIKPADAVYIKSSTEPFDDQMQINEDKVKNWLDLFGIHYVDKGFHASGHANGQEILEMIRKVNPDKIYPIHTEHPEEFDVLQDDGIDVIYPKKSKNIEI
ncbi:MAG: MBL fold metallo-hydrolase [Methanobacterium sp.]|nr:MBL fold metallo-hydrolase [Methanobacterium sp.]